MTGQSPVARLLVSEKEAATLIGVSSRMLVSRRFCGKPLLPFVRVGSRNIRYQLADIEEFIRANRVGGSS